MLLMDGGARVEMLRTQDTYKRCKNCRWFLEGECSRFGGHQVKEEGLCDFHEEPVQVEEEIRE